MVKPSNIPDETALKPHKVFTPSEIALSTIGAGAPPAIDMVWVTIASVSDRAATSARILTPRLVRSYSIAIAQP